MELSWNGSRIVGSVVRTKIEFVLEPVGLDWDGTFKPIEKLTYPDDQVEPFIVDDSKEN